MIKKILFCSIFVIFISLIILPTINASVFSEKHDSSQLIYSIYTWNTNNYTNFSFNILPFDNKHYLQYALPLPEEYGVNSILLSGRPKARDHLASEILIVATGTTSEGEEMTLQRAIDEDRLCPRTGANFSIFCSNKSTPVASNGCFNVSYACAPVPWDNARSLKLEFCGADAIAVQKETGTNLSIRGAKHYCEEMLGGNYITNNNSIGLSLCSVQPYYLSSKSYPSGTINPGHKSNEIYLNISGVKRDLQTIINEGNYFCFDCLEEVNGYIVWETHWLPSTLTVCQGTEFVQTSNCGRTRNAIGMGFCQ